MTLSHAEYQAIANKLRPNGQAFIDGKFCDASDGETFQTTNPATGQVLCSVAHCKAADVDRAVTAARRAFNAGVWSRAEPEARKEVLLKIADLVRDHTHELAVLESLDTGKTINDCMDEIGGEVPKFFQWYAELADKVFGKIAPTGPEALALITKEPAGIAGAVLPWNFPLVMAAWKIAPSLAVGCSAVIKPAEQTPLSTIFLAELMQKAGVPDGVVNIVPGFGETAGKAIGLHNDIDTVSFTGSTEVGRMFMRYSGDSNLKGVGLEMGGKSPFIVLEDALLNDDLIEHAAMSAFWNGGQNCSANMRQLIAAPLVEDFTGRIMDRVKSFKLGDPLDPDTDIGSMITKDHKDMVMNYIQSGIDDGARLLTGGGSDLPGYFIEPTVFQGVAPDMKIAREEIFGPVLGIMPFKTADEALRVASDTDYGLHATVFSQDIDRALHMARSLPCGTVSVNGFSEGDIKTPFGGYKQSGSLARDNGTEALDQYLQTKTIWIQTRAM
ncbi:Aldehyde dehydrogenase PuuC [Roseibium album]|uniref:Aldehyde dehydrogenase PuuC n=1 Tax=Roseibium album TaxID=311410 RepID=A0A0M6ZZE8_9HYPH|nr:aldehyde dehydrogenase [Roseibium album]MBG6159296.1 aldehyde dehydrogenase (NAD+)/gamma-glutamyl-gamma-aminobutyraldehyde dehydrogenase [Labrenzia sp. EL_162]MBG6197616.1 aldehyde dehydrogenase (NAD+)/gamma-glutamyl-gamma-aminobutyraldehyde dehydrogenase [Labrenzia sp. EL_159]CTQ67596.1 Aldehyde dehydrogenase PuuC [Roseibium album]CTQ70142.1 Aldehyde dehydrogenase PuuC [Roseibium album]